LRSHSRSAVRPAEEEATAVIAATSLLYLFLASTFRNDKQLLAVMSISTPYAQHSTAQGGIALGSLDITPSHLADTSFSAAAAGGAQSTSSAPASGNNLMAIEDCRDYLRTGRCKYGASCKYRHPANVQSGGGMRIPLNPGEPMFPVRPNEPIW
jgi:hypothetical protein